MRRSLPAVLGTIGLFLGVSSLAMQARSASTAVPTPGQLVGSYRYAGDRTKDENAIKAKSDVATAEMGRMELKRAVPRLESSTRIPQRVSILRQDGNVTFKMDDYVVAAPENGSSAPVTTPLGETADASFDVKTATLLQSVAKTGGQKRNVFRFSETGELMMEVRITNSRLAAPVVFTLRYARSE